MEAKKIIQSFGRRRARGLSETQKTNLVTLYEKYGISLPESVVVPKDYFDTKFENLAVEIGFGRGEHLIQNAINNPKTAFIGCEPFENGVASALKSIADNSLENVRIYKGDARLLLDFFPPQSLSKVFVLFPDPWTKKKHYKRRLLSTEFLQILTTKIQNNGEIIIATDCENYMLNVLDNLKNLQNIDYSSDLNLLSTKPHWFLSTRYEQKALSQGKKCYYLQVVLKE